MTSHKRRCSLGTRGLRNIVGVSLFLTAVIVPGLSWGAEKPILAHYMPWFVAKPHSPTWGFHWTMNSQDPDGMDSPGRRQIAAHLQPRIGPYDNADPGVLEYHVLLMKLAGIDGVIVDWYGMDDVHDFAANEARTVALLDAIRSAGLKFCLCYEDSTIQAAIDTGRIPEAEAVAHGQQTLLYAQRTYFNDSSYLRLSQGQPVLLNFGPRFFRSARQWAALFSVLDPTNRPALFTQDHRVAGGAGAFNWPPMHLSHPSGGILSRDTLEGYLDDFELQAQGWPAFISSAFPRFHDYYEQAGIRPSFGHLADDGGAVFRETLTRAVTNDAALVQLVTWNDFGEGTVIEPTLEYGYRDLGVIQECRRDYLTPDFSYDTNDLHLATRLYHLRHQHGASPPFARELDEIFQDIVRANLTRADQRLSALESGLLKDGGTGSDYSMLRFHPGGDPSAPGSDASRSSDPPDSERWSGDPSGAVLPRLK